MLYVGLCSVPLCTTAQIFKCVDPKTGAKTYSGVPCATTHQATTLATPHYPTLRASHSTQPSSVSQAVQDRSEPLERMTRSTSSDVSGRVEVSYDKTNSIECEEEKRKVAV